MSINITISVREAILLLSGGEISNTLCEQIIAEIEKKCGSVTAAAGNLNLTLKKIPKDKIISTIKVIRTATGWGLKDSKDFCDVVRGSWSPSGNGYINGTPNTLTASHGTVKQLEKQLTEIGCEVFIDSW